ncbi:hypothetical protein AAY473_038559 [Plecturocebus cupreus]
MWKSFLKAKAWHLIELQAPVEWCDLSSLKPPPPWFKDAKRLVPSYSPSHFPVILNSPEYSLIIEEVFSTQICGENIAKSPLQLDQQVQLELQAKGHQLEMMNT